MLEELKKPIWDKHGNILNEREIRKRIEQFRKMVEDDDELHVRLDDNFLTRYLFPTHFDVEAAYKRMRDYYKLKCDWPEAWYQSTPQNLKHFLDVDGFKTMLNDRGQDGHRVFITRMGRVPKNLTVNELTYIDDLYMESILDETETQQNGLRTIIDLKDLSWSLLKWCTPHNLSIATRKAELTPLTELHYHVVNTSMVLNTVITLVWPFLNAHTKKQIHFHYTDWPSLHKFIRPDVLPIEYGGKLTVNHHQLTKKFVYDRTPSIVKNLGAALIPRNKEVD